NTAYTGDLQSNKHTSASYGNPSSPSPITAPPGATKEEIFTRTIQIGDSLFGLKKYADALVAFTAAGNLKPTDQSVKKKIEDCNKELLNIAQKIPRVIINEGSFTMGTDNGNPDDGPAHTVSLPRFALSKTEVTVSQYKSFCLYTGRHMPQEPGYGWTDNAPVVNVSWEDAMAYCKWVGGRLPTEAEWEYAAAAGVANIYSGSNRIDNVAIYGANSHGKPAMAAKKSPNAFGLYDMTGNVAEWCADWYGRKYYEQSGTNNPQGANSGNEKVIRGGAYNSAVNSTQDGNQLRITYRNSESLAARHPYIGFRVAWNL
ncbi:MAG TPA: SUMF1/EgtB/PvdO family nonheme iron enzyme, partial [Niastella sp.]